MKFFRMKIINASITSRELNSLRNTNTIRWKSRNITTTTTTTQPGKITIGISEVLVITFVVNNGIRGLSEKFVDNRNVTFVNENLDLKRMSWYTSMNMRYVSRK